MNPRQSGFVLLYVVALVAALSLMLAQLNQRQGAVPEQTERSLSHALQRQEAEMLVDFVLAGIHEQNVRIDSRFLTFRRLIAEDPSRVSELEDALQQLKALLDSVGFQIRLGGRGAGAAGLATKADHEDILYRARREPYTVTLGDRAYTVQVTPGNALPNLNSLDFPGLRRYLAFLGMPGEEADGLAANLIDWMDPDDFRTDGRGAEFSYYVTLDPPYPPRNAPFRTWQEIAYVKGVSTERLRLLRDNFVLANPADRRWLGDYASPEKIAAFTGIKPEAVREMLTAHGKAAQPATTERRLPDVTNEEASLFDDRIGWKENTERLRIEISGPRFSQSIDYDARNRRILARW